MQESQSPQSVASNVMDNSKAKLQQEGSHTAIDIHGLKKPPSENGDADTDSVSFDPIEDVESVSTVDEEDRLRVDMSWEDLHFAVKQKKQTKTILDGISGEVNSGQMLAIMGASGAGKTSLLNLLAGRLTSSKNYISSGRVLVNGKKRNYANFKKYAAYVMQDDDMFAEMTVREHITFSAMLRLPPDMPMSAKMARVDQIIHELGLKKVENTYIGNAFLRGVSGGERKRVNIGVELVTDPSLIFLDEPTSGLDSFNALNVMLSLRHLCQNGRTVITTIHQPRSNIYNLFDNLLLLSEGKTMYFGKADRAVEYFGATGFQCPANYNPADYFIDLLSQDTRLPKLEQKSRNRVKYLGDAYDAHVEKKKTDEADLPAMATESAAPPQDEERFSTSWANELKYLVSRNFKLMFRERQSNIARFMQNLVFSIFLGLIWLNTGRDWEDNMKDFNLAFALLGVLFFIVVNQAFGSVFGVIFNYPLERSVVLRERASGTYRVSPYHVGKIVSELPRTLFLTLEFSIPVYFMVGLHTNFWSFLIFWLIGILVVMVTESMALCVTTMLPNPQAASAFMPVLIIFAMLFGGFFIGSNQIPEYIRWGQWLSFIKYAFDAAAQNQFQHWPEGERILEQQGLDTLPLAANIAILFGFYVFWRSLLYVILRIDKPKFDRTL